MKIEFKETFRLSEGSARGKEINEFEFILQEDGNVVLYRYDEGGSKAIWASDTNVEGEDLKLWLQEDGSLSLRYADNNALVWSTYTGDIG